MEHITMEELKARIKAQDASFAEIRRKREELLASADEILATYREINAGYDRINDYFQSKIECSIQEMVDYEEADADDSDE
jgi:hypothetical protein